MSELQSNQPVEQASNESQLPADVRDMDAQSDQPTQEAAVPHDEPQNEQTQEQAPDRTDELVNLIQDQKDTIENLKKGLYEQGDKLAKRYQEQAPESTSEGDEMDAAVDLIAAKLQEKGLIGSDVSALEKKLDDQRKLDEIVQSNPMLDRKLLATLKQANPDTAYENIIEDFNLNKGEKLISAQEARSSVMGQPIPKVEQKPKSVSEMSPDEFKNFIGRNSTGSTLI